MNVFNEHELDLDPEFLDRSDREMLSEIVGDYLSEKGIKAESYSFGISICYIPEGETDDGYSL